MAKKEDKTGIKVLTIEGAVYLGTLTTKDGLVTVDQALCLGTPADVTKKHLIDYFEARNLDTLETIEIGGNGTSYSQRALSENLAIEFQVLELKLAQAVTLAPKKLVNAEFKTLAGN